MNTYEKQGGSTDIPVPTEFTPALIGQELSPLTPCPHQVVEAEFKQPVIKFLKTDAPQRLLQFRNRNAFLMLVALHLRAHEPQPTQNPQNRVGHEGRPRQYQRTPGREHPVRFAKHELRRHEMLQYGQHHHMIELARWQRQWRTDIRVNALPTPSGALLDLVVHAHAADDSVRGILQESGFQAAA